MMDPVQISSGDSPVVLGQPHGGTFVPQDITEKLNDNGHGLADTDWHITQLYDGLVDGLTTVSATFHRYVIDANRDPMGASLYPGQNTTTLSPQTDFDGEPIWRVGYEPDHEETERRRLLFHRPYHAALKQEIARVKNIHGFAILFDCHSIRSEIPFLFEGTLPVFNTGTNDGTTCHPLVEQAIVGCCVEANPNSHVLNGRFKGGWTTRHYGMPSENVHAIQMEIAQRSYMTERPPWNFDHEKASVLRPQLCKMLQSLKGMNPSLLANS